MRFLFAFCLFSFVVFVISCRGKKDAVYDQSIPHISLGDFKYAGEIKCSASGLPGVEYPLRLCIVPKHNLLLVLDGSDKTFWVKAFTLDSCRPLSGFIKRGTGKDELVDAFQMQYDPEADELYVAGPLSKKILVYSFAGASQNVPYKFSQALTAKKSSGNQISLHAPVVLNARHEIADLLVNKKDSYRMLGFYDSSLGLLKTADDFPIENKSEPGYILEQLFVGALSLSEDHTTIIHDCYATDMLTLYNTDGTLRKRVRGPVLEPLAYNIQNVSSNSVRVLPAAGAHLGYTAKAVMKGNDMFVLYNGKPFNHPDYHCSDLFQFGFDLAPRSRYKLDHAIYQLDIDWRNGTAYGLRNRSRPEIVSFKLPL